MAVDTDFVVCILADSKNWLDIISSLGSLDHFICCSEFSLIIDLIEAEISVVYLVNNSRNKELSKIFLQKHIVTEL